MRSFVISLIIVLSVHTVFTTPKAQASDPKLKAFLITSGYGTVGGALLGLASIAFGSGERAIFQGASLGLYTGMIFGAYIIFSHRSAQDLSGSYQDVATPYDDDGSLSPYSDDYGAPGGAQRAIGISNQFHNRFKSKRENSVPVYFNVINLRF